MKYNVGDKVRIKSIDWYNENKDEDGDVPCGEFDFVEGMKKFCSEVFTISEDVGDGYLMLEDSYGYVWTDEMIEGLVEEETKPEPKFKVGDSIEVLKSGNVYTISQMKFNGKEFVYTLSNNGSTVSCFSEEEIKFTEEDKYWCDIMSESDPTTYVLPQGYIFKDENGNVINVTKIVLEKKKKEYPKTYVECYSVLGYEPDEDVVSCYKGKLIESFVKLLICRDAYWKIAGEEMGLNGPWKPDWTANDNHFYTIHTFNGKIECSATAHRNAVLIFPTEEMRDAFYENFKELIEQCKELL